MCDLLFFYLPHGQPPTVFRGLISISGGWVLLCKGLMAAEGSPHITVLCTVALGFYSVTQDFVLFVTSLLKWCGSNWCCIYYSAGVVVFVFS